MAEDPLEPTDLRKSDASQVVKARERLAKVLASLPENAARPFEGYKAAGDKTRKAENSGTH